MGTRFWFFLVWGGEICVHVFRCMTLLISIVLGINLVMHKKFQNNLF